MGTDMAEDIHKGLAATGDSEIVNKFNMLFNLKCNFHVPILKRHYVISYKMYYLCHYKWVLVKSFLSCVEQVPSTRTVTTLLRQQGTCHHYCDGTFHNIHFRTDKCMQTFLYKWYFSAAGVC